MIKEDGFFISKQEPTFNEELFTWYCEGHRCIQSFKTQQAFYYVYSSKPTQDTDTTILVPFREE